MTYRFGTGKNNLQRFLLRVFASAVPRPADFLATIGGIGLVVSSMLTLMVRSNEIMFLRLLTTAVDFLPSID